MEDKVYKKSGDFILREIDKEVFIIPLKDAGEDEPLYSFSNNETAKIAFSLIDGERSTKEIIAKLEEMFEGDKEEITKDTIKFLQELEKEGIIVDTHKA